MKTIKINQTKLLLEDGCELNAILSIQEKIASSLVEPLVAKPLERSAISKVVADLIKGFAHKPAIVFNNNVHEVFPSVNTDGIKVYGALVGDTIHLFTDNLDSVERVQKTLFHELLDYGLQ